MKKHVYSACFKSNPNNVEQAENCCHDCVDQEECFKKEPKVLGKDEHAECSPSQLSRIIGCPGSRRLSRSLPDESSPYAEEGTMLHRCTEYRILEALSFAKYADVDLKTQRRTKDHKEVKALIEGLNNEQVFSVQDCVDYFFKTYNRLVLLGKVEVYLEARTSLDYLGLDEVEGQTDVLFKVYTKFGLLIVVIDWKFGQGVPVKVEQNPQVLAYALGAVGDDKDFKEVYEFEMHIVQPRREYFACCSITFKEMENWLVNTLTPAIVASRKPDSECIPGEVQCRWCKAKKCRKRAEQAMRYAEELFGPYAVLPDFIEDSEVAPMLEKAKVVEGYIKALTARALSKCVRGEEFPGFKAVAGRSSRVWKSEATAKQFFMGLADQGVIEFEDAFPTTFVTVPQAEKLTRDMKKNKEFKDLWLKKPGNPTLVKEDDPRPAYVEDVGSIFKDFIN